MTRKAEAMSGSTIIEGNSFSQDNPEALDTLSPEDRKLVERRKRALGPSYRLFYRHPVHVVRSKGSYLYGPDGEEYLDAYNNVASIGHAHPAVVEAVHEQMAQLSTHSRYIQDGVLDYAEQLLATFPDELDQVMFTNSGSEANDLALRVAAAYTGGKGVVVTSEAYHGTSAAVSAVSPSAGGEGLAPYVRAVPAPDSFRYRPEDHDGKTLAEWFADNVRAAFTELAEAGYPASALLVDSIFSSDGVFPDTSVLDPAVAATRELGGVFISDEVQPGFGRIGRDFWGFARHGVVPEIVTLGKPMGNGVPVAGMVVRGTVLSTFGTDIPYFNTYGGSSVPVAAAQAVLNVIEDEGLAEKSSILGDKILGQLQSLTEEHPEVGDVRGAGLFFGVEIVEPGTTAPDSARALNIINTMRDMGVLCSVAGPYNSTLKIRPLLSYTTDEADRLVRTLADAIIATKE
jgi:4-aminobutyrate aminotransferase-like enzyme